MITPTEPENEKERLEYLKSFSILDTLPEDDYDNITKIATEICDMPVALISLIDDKRQWFKSHHGLDATETPKEYAFCAHAINDPHNVFIIQDARKDERFIGNPLVDGEPAVIFYAGVPLTLENGLPLGTLCVIDHKPNLLSQSQIQSLSALSNQVMKLLELRKNKFLLESTLQELEEKNHELERFAYVAAHDLKSPLLSITGLANLLVEEYKVKIDGQGIQMLEMIIHSSESLASLIDGLLAYSKSDSVLNQEASIIKLDEMNTEILELFNFDHDVKMTVNSTLPSIKANKTAIYQILINLVANAIKYNDKEVAEIEISVSETNKKYKFRVKDNGPGIAPENQHKIFNIFEKLNSQDRFGREGNGIGLATVKKLVEKLGGAIKVDSELGHGATFSFTINK
ncbi:GAF domain-containing sensor histidine kinase [Tamlana crocina]|uniref:histidine kinase n=1 Tax=Tamlana crocina TaxID=393006 RepID=A0ABX1DF53_9FLAO|nr:ATP-binding protein [Tamlana crocina]NJX16072.1 GAF domain-containing protein [Tamlana crocina]